MTKITTGEEVMSDETMLQQIWGELRYIRQRLDDHVDDETADLKDVKADIIKIREEMASTRTRHRIVNSSIVILMAGIVSWAFNHLGIGSSS